VRLGYDLFDSAMPARDGRRGRLYAFAGDPASAKDGFLDFVYAADRQNGHRNTPADAGCDCVLCSRYSLGYLHHLFKLGDPLYARLATLHNLRFMTRLLERLAAGPAPAG
jgi:queuine tRNA-ribosyltransferase